MNNFFYEDSEYSLFKKALRATRNEPVVINILSSDSSLKGNEQTDDKKSVEQRKNMSNKFEPTSPFGKFFGPRKPRTAPVDMKDFSSWKNKNYRKVEETLNDKQESAVKFNVADFMKERSGKEKYHSIDQIKSETQKPITQLSSSDSTYKKFYLDSYLNKLEQQSKTKNKFEENDDLLEPLGDRTQNVIPDSSQDENFLFSSKVDVEDLALEDDLYGEKYKIEQAELERVKSRLEKLEQDERYRNKANEKIISGNELSEIVEGKNEEQQRDEDKLVDDIEKLNERLKKVESMQAEQADKVEDDSDDLDESYDDEENVTDEDENSYDNDDNYSEEDEASDEDDNELKFESGENEEDETSENEANNEESEGDETSDESVDDLSEEENTDNSESYLGQKETHSSERLNRDDILTKEDFKAMSDELINKFTEMYKKDENTNVPQNDAVAETGYMTDMYYNPNEQYVDGYNNNQVYDQVNAYSQNDELNQAINEENEKRQAEMQAKLDELIEQNKKADERIEESLRQAEIEKQKVAEEYETKIKELEESYKQHVEDMKKQSYLEKIDRDIKLQEAQSDFKRREKEIKDLQKANSDKQNAGAMLRRELKSNLNISNLEMDKKLLEISSQNKNAYLSNSQLSEIDEDTIKNAINETATRKNARTSSAKKNDASVKANVNVTKAPSKRRRKKSNRRKIDSDIIGSIDFE